MLVTIKLKSEHWLLSIVDIVNGIKGCFKRSLYDFNYNVVDISDDRQIYEYTLTFQATQNELVNALSYLTTVRKQYLNCLRDKAKDNEDIKDAYLYAEENIDKHFTHIVSVEL